MLDMLEKMRLKVVENVKRDVIAINDAISKLGEMKGNVSDGHHTFDELYFHRMILFSVICKMNSDKTWRSKLHHDGTMCGKYFVVGIITPEGDYTYHYHMEHWNHFDGVRELDRAPEWDGHQPKDVVRLLSLVQRCQDR